MPVTQTKVGHSHHSVQTGSKHGGHGHPLVILVHIQISRGLPYSVDPVRFESVQDVVSRSLVLPFNQSRGPSLRHLCHSRGDIVHAGVPHLVGRVVRGPSGRGPVGRGEVVVRMAGPAPRADKPDGEYSRWSYALGLWPTRVVEFHVLRRVTAASWAGSDGILVRAVGDHFTERSDGLWRAIYTATLAYLWEHTRRDEYSRGAGRLWRRRQQEALPRCRFASSSQLLKNVMR